MLRTLRHIWVFSHSRSGTAHHVEAFATAASVVSARVAVQLASSFLWLSTTGSLMFIPTYPGQVYNCSHARLCYTVWGVPYVLISYVFMKVMSFFPQPPKQTEKWGWRRGVNWRQSSVKPMWSNCDFNQINDFIFNSVLAFNVKRIQTGHIYDF